MSDGSSIGARRRTSSSRSLPMRSRSLEWRLASECGSHTPPFQDSGDTYSGRRATTCTSYIPTISWSSSRSGVQPEGRHHHSVIEQRARGKRSLPPTAWPRSQARDRTGPGALGRARCSGSCSRARAATVPACRAQEVATAGASRGCRAARPTRMCPDVTVEQRLPVVIAAVASPSCSVVVPAA